jgi:hypothetical protein
MLQFFEMGAKSNMTEGERADVFDLLHVIALKFAAIWTHDHRYEVREKELTAASEADPVDRRKNVPMRFASAQDLYIEWDGFLVQCKSVLDHMVNILHYTLGINFSSLTSFRNNGTGIINVLKRNVGGTPPGKKKAAALLIKHIENNQDWLKGMIEARDRMNHFLHGGMSPMAFGVASIIEKDGIQTLHRPMLTKDLILKDVMKTVMSNVLEFIEYFMGISIAVRMPDYAVQWLNSEDPTRPRWNVVHASIVQQMVASGQIDPGKIV